MEDWKIKMATKSLYGDGTFQRELPIVHTVGELKVVLCALPDDLPLNGDEGLKPRWFNVGKDGSGCNCEHLDFDDLDLEDW